jgi:hypothetical protein
MIVEAVYVQVVGGKRIKVLKTLKIYGLFLHHSDRFAGFDGFERLKR